jgi:MYXO-CTERM domain-containing protein
MKRVLILLCAVAVIGGSLALPASASIGVVTGPGVGDPNGSIGARIRWGASGWEGAIRRGAPANTVNQTLNPTGTPVWQLDTPYDFQVTWTGATGTMGLTIDFGGTIGSQSISHVFTDRIGWGFNVLQISGNESGGSTRRSNVSNLSINGFSQSTLTPNGTLLDTYYGDSSSNLLSTITIDGTFTMTAFGTGNDERPSWNFSLRDPQAVPEPGALTMWAVGLLGVCGIRCLRRRRRWIQDIPTAGWRTKRRRSSRGRPDQERTS